MTGQRRKSSPVKLVIILLIAALASYAGYRALLISRADREAKEVLATMYDLIPGLGVDSDTSTGLGRDPLLTLSINNIDIVGCLEIPSIDLMVPVTVRDGGKDGLASVASGSPVKGSFMLEGDRNTTFRKLFKARPGDKVTFTDTEGIRYNYSVTTQFNLRDWDESDHDLMVTYRIDSSTRFVLGCAAAE